MGENTWTHLGIFAAFLAVIVPIWLDLRHQHHTNQKEYRDNQQKNSERLTAIETMLKPVWDWFTKTNGG